MNIHFLLTLKHISLIDLASAFQRKGITGESVAVQPLVNVY